MNFGGPVHLNRMGVCFLFFCFIIIALYMVTDVEDTESIKPVMINVRQVLLAALELAEKGGQEVVKVRKKTDFLIESKGKTQEGANDPVTEADYNSHCIMYYGLKKAFPKLKIISEEEVQQSKCGELASPSLSMEPPLDSGFDNILDEHMLSRDLTVWIDPLDATQEFSENLLQYVTTLICVAYKGRPIIGVIHRPFGVPPQTSWAWVRRGMSPDLMAYKDLVERNPAIIVSRSHSGVVEKVTKEALGPETPIIKAGGAGYKVMQVVSGNASAYIHITKIKKWDICAGDAVMSALGGTMSAVTGEEILYSSSGSKVNTNGLLVARDNYEYYKDSLHKALRSDINF